MLAYLDRIDMLWRGQLEAAAGAAGPGRATASWACSPRSNCVPPRGLPRLRFHQHGGRVAVGLDVHARTVEHKATVRAWVNGLATAAGARDPDRLALGLTLLLDGEPCCGRRRRPACAAAAGMPPARSSPTSARRSGGQCPETRPKARRICSLLAPPGGSGG